MVLFNRFVVGLLVQTLSVLAVPATQQPEKRAGFNEGQPIDNNGKGAPLLGGTNHQIDLQNPDNLGGQSTVCSFLFPSKR